MKNYLLKLQKTFLVLLLFFSPLVFTPFFDYPFETGKAIIFYFIGSLLFLILGLRIISEKISICLPRVALIFFFTNLISYIFSWDKNISLWGKYGYYTDGLVFLFYCLVVFLATVNLKLTKVFIKKTVFVAALTILIISIFGIKEYFLGKYKTGEIFYRISSSLGQPNRLAHFLLPLNIFILFSLSLFKKLPEKIFLFITVFLGFVAFILTFSRSNYLILGLTFLVIIGLEISKKSISKKVFFLLMVTAVSFFLHKNFFLNFKSIFRKDPYNSPYLRLVEQVAAFQDWKDKSLFYKLVGAGPETLTYTYLPVKPLVINQNKNEWFHKTSKIRNQYLHYLNTIGVIGLGSYLLIIFYFLFLKSKNSNQGAYFSIITVVISNFFYYQTIPVVIYFWFFLGILNSKKSLNFSFKVSSKLAKMLFLLTVVLGFVCQLNLLGRFALADYFSHTNKIESLQKAVKLFPYLASYKRKLGKKHLTTALYFGEEKKLLFFDKEINRAIFWYQEAINLNPKDVDSLRSLQWAFYNAGSKLDKKYQEKNVLLSQKIVELSPKDPLTYDSLGLAYLDLGEYEWALRSFKKALELKPDFVGSYLHIGETLKQTGRLNEAITFYQKAVELEPNFPMAIQELRKAQDLLDKHN